MTQLKETFMVEHTIEINPLPGDNSAAILAALHELREGGRLVLAPGRIVQAIIGYNPESPSSLRL
jgi:hypothetical protein